MRRTEPRSPTALGLPSTLWPVPISSLRPMAAELDSVSRSFPLEATEHLNAPPGWAYGPPAVAWP